MTGTQHETPTKARIKGAYDFLTAKGIPFQKTDLFDHFQIPRRSGYRILDGPDRTRHNQPGPETRGRKRKLSETDLDKLETLYENEGFEAKRLPWTTAAIEAGIEADVSVRTIRRAAHTRDIYKRLAQVVEFKNQQEADRRLDWADRALAKRPKKQHWRNVRFSDESHFGYGDEDQAQIARKPGTRADPSNLQERKEPDEKDLKRLHCWAAIGYNFKSLLVWYEIPTNNNGKMTQQVYIKEILEPYVKKWLDEGYSFVLEEDGDSGHGPSQHNPVRAWKEKYNLDSFFNCPCSPDLSPIENCWLIPKEYIRRYPHWDAETLKDLAEEGWKQLSQKTINNWVDSMPKRLHHVQKLKGKMTAW